MKKQRLIIGVTLLAVCALLAPGCETLTELIPVILEEDWVKLIVTVANALEEVEQERQATRDEVLEEYETPPTQPVARVEGLNVAPDPVHYGQTLNITGSYTVLNVPSDAKPEGTLTLYYTRDNEPKKKLHSKDIEVEKEGRQRFSTQMKTPRDLYEGTYEVHVTIKNHGSKDTKQTDFVLTDG